MLSYIKKYPISLFIILTVIYLSFFKPPKTDLNEIPNLDKLVHICMYFGMSGMLWLEFLRAHRRDDAPLWHAWVGAFLCPILFSGCVELLQEYCTTYRGETSYRMNTYTMYPSDIIIRCLNAIPTVAL